MTMLAISQKPERVSNILRSSTPTRRVSGIRADAVRRAAAVRPPTSARGRVEDGGGGHAAAPSRWVSAVSSRNISSSPAPSAARSSVRARPAASATSPTWSGVASVCTLPSAWAVTAEAGALHRQRPSAAVSRARATVPAEASRSALVPWATIRPLPMTTRSSAMTSISCSRCEREQDGAAAVGEAAQQVAHPADAGRVEPVGRLVEDQHVRVAEQGGRRCRGAGACRGSSRAPAGRPRRR